LAFAGDLGAVVLDLEVDARKAGSGGVELDAKLMEFAVGGARDQQERGLRRRPFDRQ